MPAPIVFLDTETTGLGPDDEPWEIAAIRRDPDGTETELDMFVEHDTSRIPNLPQRFRIDWATRYDPEDAVSRDDAGSKLGGLLDRPGGFERCVIVASNPAFGVGVSGPWAEVAGSDGRSHFRYEVDTANGRTRAAAATIDRLEIDRISVGPVQAVVLDDTALSGTLIGMSFLRQLRRFGVEAGTLILEQ